MLTIYLARHGQDEDNAAGILNGRRDQQLTELGKRQARILAQKIVTKSTASAVNEIPTSFDAVYSSPLKRAAMTADIVVENSSSNFNEPVERLDALMERDFGVLTGTPVTEIETRCGSENVLKTPKVTYFLSPEGAETFPQLMDRAKRLIQFLQERHAVDASILLVTHGDFGKMFYAAYYNLDWKDVLQAFHFGNSDLILCSPKIMSPPDPKDTHVLLSSETHPGVTCNPSPIHLKELVEGPPAALSQDGKSATAKLLVDCRCLLGECVLYDNRQNAVVFTSILERKFHKLPLNGDKLQSFDLPKMLCAFGLLENPIGPSPDRPGYVVAWDDGFQLYDLEGGEKLGPMSEGEVVNRAGLPDRLNDGRIDPTGKRFVCGCCVGTPDGPLKVYKCEYDSMSKTLKHSPVVDEIRTTNSICWSNDGNTMYLADSPTKRIDQFNYDLESGELSNKRPLHNKELGDPDGSVVDAQGFVWNATWRQGKGTAMVDRIDPKTGEVVFTVYLQDETSEASCCCFGGPNLDILFITTAFEHLDPVNETHAGGIYAIKLPPGISGCPEKRFKLNLADTTTAITLTKKRKQADSRMEDDSFSVRSDDDDSNNSSPTITLSYVELYSGIGGWTMALEAAIKRQMINGRSGNERTFGKAIKLKRLASLDHSDLCNRVFEHNFGPAVTTSGKGKVKTAIDRLSLKQMDDWAADILVMSPPCQPHTRQHSNQEQDISDPRSSSFLHICDLLQAMKSENLPSHIFLENVVGFEVSNSFQRWLDVLRERDFLVGHFHLTPTQVALPNDRPRYYCVAIQRRCCLKMKGKESYSSPTDGADRLLPHSLAKYVAPVLNDFNSKSSPRPLPLVTKAIPELTVALESTVNEERIATISTFLDRGRKQDVQNRLTVPQKILQTSASWCFDIVGPNDRRSACFTHSYGRFVRGTGSILYDTIPESGESMKLAEPAARQYQEDWMKEIDSTKLRYFSGDELARLFGFSDAFTFPENVSMKQQWKLMGNSLNVAVASHIVELGLLLSQLAECTNYSQQTKK